MTREELDFVYGLLDHLDYCEWGGAWKRKVSENLKRHAEKWQEENPRLGDERFGLGGGKYNYPT